MRVYIETYGCSSNQAESEIMAGLLKQSGFEIVDNPNIAEIIIINSCYVKHVTEQKLIFRITEIQKLYPEKKIIITGCAPEGIYEKLSAMNLNLVSTHHIKKIPKVVTDILKGKKVELLGKTKDIKVCLPKIRKNPIRNIVKIAEGCTGKCSYCATRIAKGELFSYPKEMILKEIESSVKNGCKEIWLTAQDTSAYGLDSDTNLSELLNSVCNIKGKFFVRVGMMNPKNFLRESFIKSLIEAYKSEKIYKFLHLPVQSGSDKILEKMRRGYRVEDFLNIVSMFKKEFPELNLWTDVIVGFPEETEDDFKKTMELLKEVKPDYTNISQYGVREKTEASKLKQVTSEIKKERSKMASELTRKISFERNKKWIGWKGKVLITERRIKGNQILWIGRNFAYKSVTIDSEKKLLGKFVNVEIIDAGRTGLIGELI